MKPVVVITGGAGYIGSHTAYLLVQKGYEVIIIDNLVHRQSWPHKWATFIQHDYANGTLLKTLFSSRPIEAVLHFAAYIDVSESVKNPLSYYETNVAKTITLLQSMREHHINRFIFSSTCAVYGLPQSLPLTEQHATHPVSPYGMSKLMVEQFLHDMHQAHHFNYVSLRYFNAAGALADVGLGEQHDPETHLIPLLVRAAHTQLPFTLFGTNHPTPDGTCIRDFVHVWDIAYAHWLALEHLKKDRPSDIFNLGTGTGFSVKQIIRAVEHLCKASIPVIHAKERAGEAPALVADPSHATTILGWQPHHSHLDLMIKSTRAFMHKEHGVTAETPHLPWHSL